MDYEMEELVPIVADLAERYNGNESSSITYEKAEQLMGAVMYCINEVYRNSLEGDSSTGIKALQNQKSTARETYHLGYEMVMNKTKAALQLYNEIMLEFDSYGNYYLQHTMEEGMPEFFKWYDVTYEPQNAILTLDYPVLMDIHQLQGVDKIYQYLLCIQKEQQLLKRIERNQVIEYLREYNPSYQDMVDNICRPVMERMIW